jgi:hypothetical protein
VEVKPPTPYLLFLLSSAYAKASAGRPLPAGMVASLSERREIYIDVFMWLKINLKNGIQIDKNILFTR